MLRFNKATGFIPGSEAIYLYDGPNKIGAILYKISGEILNVLGVWVEEPHRGNGYGFVLCDHIVETFESYFGDQPYWDGKHIVCGNLVGDNAIDAKSFWNQAFVRAGFPEPLDEQATPNS